jgi:hypothetical protein
MSACPAVGTATSNSSNSTSIPSGSLCSTEAADRLNSTGLIFELMAKLLELLVDRDVVGEAEQPAAWLERNAWYRRNAVGVYCDMLKGLEDAASSLIDGESDQAKGSEVNDKTTGTSNYDSNETQLQCWGDLCKQHPLKLQQLRHPSDSDAGLTTTGQHGRGSVQAALDRALQLASLVPRVPWDHLTATVAHISADEHQDFLGICMYLVDRTAVLLLRVVTMLVCARLVPEQHKQGVVALMGGVPSGSGSASNTSRSGKSNFLPLPEPSSLAEARQQAGVTLQDLSYLFLLVDVLTSKDDGEQRSAAPRCPSLARHLALAFGVHQIPWLASVQQASQPGSQGLQQDSEEDSGLKQLNDSAATAGAWLAQGDSTMATEYTSWVQACLYRIIDEALIQSGH